jgi:hypothetical protein
MPALMFGTKYDSFRKFRKAVEDPNDQTALIGTPADADYFARYPGVYNWTASDGNQPYVKGQISGYWHYLNYGRYDDPVKTYNLTLNEVAASKKINWKLYLILAAALIGGIYLYKKFKK